MTCATQILPFGTDAIAAAAALIARGLPVAIATETVYGLAADATSADAVAAIYAAKGRPAFNPLIVHVADRAAAEALALFDPLARRLAEAFWPGPLTIVAPSRPGTPIAALAVAGLPTVALRVPAFPAMRALIAASGRPLAAPSANASGSISPTTAAHVLRSLGGRIPLIVDAGATPQGIESTIVAITGGQPRVLRPGPITTDMIEAVVRCRIAEVMASGTIEAPGLLAQHYAPAKPLRLNAITAAPDERLIGFGPIAGHVSLSAAGDLREAAARLFDLLHDADAGPCARIAVAPIPDRGLGVAINDRLARAATR